MKPKVTQASQANLIKPITSSREAKFPILPLFLFGVCPKICNLEINLKPSPVSLMNLAYASLCFPPD
jgi:hypothetical protein